LHDLVVPARSLKNSSLKTWSLKTWSLKTWSLKTWTVTPRRTTSMRHQFKAPGKSEIASH